MTGMTRIVRLRLTLARVAAALRAIAGVPDYDRYAAHMRECHPGTPLLTPAELFALRQRDRFERPGGTCC
jgi:uncharacterized short protein YbdD (DUF466 family)